MHFFNFDRLLRTRVHFAAILTVGLLYGNIPAAFAYQTEDTTTTKDTTLTEAPYAVDDYLMTSYDTAIVFNPLENDMPGSAPIDPSTLTIEVAPGDGTLDLLDPLTGYVEYTPNPGFVGTDSFLYTVADTDGNVSNIAMVAIDVINMPPELTSFIVTEGSANVWLFEGEVVDEDPASCTIIFGGLLEGETTTVNSDGTFSFTKILPDGVNGTVSAQAKDELGELSNILYGEVYHF